MHGYNRYDAKYILIHHTGPSTTNNLGGDQGIV